MSFVVIILAFSVSAAPGVGIVVWAVVKARRRRRLFERLRVEHAASMKGAVVLNARYASERRFRRVFKMFPWEMAGILIVQEHGIDAHLATENGKRRVSLSFRPALHTIEWKKADYFRNGFISWLVVTGSNDERHYFTSETGATIFRSTQRNVDLIEQIQTALRLAKCLKCEYVLWGNMTGVCPECGTAFVRPDEDSTSVDAPMARPVE